MNLGLAQLLKEDTVAQTVAFVEEQIKLLSFNHVQAEVLERLTVCVRLPGVELVKHWDRLNLHKRSCEGLGNIYLRQVCPRKGSSRLHLWYYYIALWKLLKPANICHRPALV